ncbi:REP element-mobilizing transposase RayT [Anaerosolibacter carboniphilus]|uniref:REP element-mobilizing transposase RayT n=1 Tax=Anaerosolibacter carboniphilus TaxID=1417629 RepID=A0A841KY42_9FIRM|nr:transposase [Anaerosolibacter carboniphilus]MBB6215045.1 REP element-mobilizing transposase RayT [Anaerosolibacter carboniphilus]
MARIARVRSKTGIYHIMLRGIDKRNIFLDDEDRMKFIEKLLKARKTAGFKLYGYCLMDNHVHLLIGEQEEIGISIKRITVGYVQWHNNKHERTGHLFQNRYMSEVVETEEYLINVLRYIHQNPVKAKITNHAKDYPWSSYQQYILAYNRQEAFVDDQLVKAYFEKDTDFEEFMNASTKEEFLEYRTTQKYTDARLRKIFETEIHIDALLEMGSEERNKIIKEIYQRTGASIRQLGRVLGVGKTIIEKAIK